jgi:hypothetical protein
MGYFTGHETVAAHARKNLDDNVPPVRLRCQIMQVAES